MPHTRRLGGGLALVVLLAVLVASAGPGAASAPAGGAPAGDADLRVVSYNLLHGTFCDDGAQCRAHDRADLFLRQLEAARCPEIVGLQEVSDDLRAHLVRRAPTVCGGDYDVVFADTRGNDTELVLTTLDARRPEVVSLPGGLRRASRVELDAPGRPVVLVVTHQDGDKTFPSCRDDITRYRCPKPCPSGTTFSTCQTVLVERLATRAGPKRALRIAMGDFNVPAGSPRHAALLDHGWIDTHLAAGNPECDPATGTECTAGRADQSLAVLQDPNARQQERIDFIFVKAPSGCRAVFDPAADADGDGVGTGLFAARPAEGGAGGLVWPSDHTAVSMDLTCV